MKTKHFLSLTSLLIGVPFVDAFCPFIRLSHNRESAAGSFSGKNVNGINSRQYASATVAVPSSELEKDLTPAERSVTGVVRSCGPAVAYVTSVIPPSQFLPQRRQHKGNNKNNNKSKDDDSSSPRSLPEGMSLGSGSGFLVAKDQGGGGDYVCTNFHVIERAYTIQKSFQDLEDVLDKTDEALGSYLPEDISKSLTSIAKEQLLSEKPPEIYVRINSATKYLQCEIVEVEPDLDLAVLKFKKSTDNNDDSNTSTIDTVNAISFGSSDDLLVGQTVVAIGNPFGLDKTVTTGVVSALNREFAAGPTVRTRNTNRPIRNAIQTDASINPGNSGGPLLNLKGEVVGINTAIISTSGSSAGIGFAVPSSQLKPVVDRILFEDRIQNGKRPNTGWLGASVIKSTATTTSNTRIQKNWVTSVEPNSPASREDIIPLRLLEDGSVEYGEAIVAVAGNDVATSKDLQSELQNRVIGEQVTLTLEDSNGNRRVAYLTLEDKPDPKNN